MSANVGDMVPGKGSLVIGRFSSPPKNYAGSGGFLNIKVSREGTASFCKLSYSWSDIKFTHKDKYYPTDCHLEKKDEDCQGMSVHAGTDFLSGKAHIDIK